MTQQDLKLGIGLVQRELSHEEQALQKQLFLLAAKFYKYVVCRLDPLEKNATDEQVSVLAEALIDHAYNTFDIEPKPLDAPEHRHARFKGEFFLLLSVFVADAFKYSVQELSRAEKLQQARVLLDSPEPDYAALVELLEGSNQGYVSEVLERIDRIIDREKIYGSSEVNVVRSQMIDVITEALTIGR